MNTVEFFEASNKLQRKTGTLVKLITWELEILDPDYSCILFLLAQLAEDLAYLRFQAEEGIEKEKEGEK